MGLVHSVLRNEPLLRNKQVGTPTYGIFCDARRRGMPWNATRMEQGQVGKDHKLRIFPFLAAIL